MICPKCNIEMEKCMFARVIDQEEYIRSPDGKHLCVIEEAFECSSCGLRAGSIDTTADMQNHLKGIKNE